jgi:AcrR family transcriptional regulator
MGEDEKSGLSGVGRRGGGKVGGMPRPSGGRNAGYEEKRRELLDKLAARLAAPDGKIASLRELAMHAGVSIPTLKHYFGDRTAVVEAVLEQSGRNGEPFMTKAASTDEPFEKSIPSLLAFIVTGFERGRLGSIHAIGLTEGLRHGMLGPAYLQSILEPTLLAVETRLSIHVAAGEMAKVDLRFAALALVSPLLLALLHQKDLGGVDVRCMDIDAFVAVHAASFVKAYKA